MHRSQERLSADAELLGRYLDGELPRAEAARFRARLASDERLEQHASALLGIGRLLRFWAEETRRRAPDLVASTLLRVARAEPPRTHERARKSPTLAQRRQSEREARAAVGGAADLNRAAVRIQDTANDRQPESGCPARRAWW